MIREKKDVFVLELPLKTTAAQEKVLLKRFEAARQVYNACLGETLRRHALLKQSKAYSEAIAMPKQDKKARSLSFRNAMLAVGFTEYDMMHWATQFTTSWLRDHIASQEVKALVSRAFQAVERYHYGTGKPCKTLRYCPKKKKNCYSCCRPKFKRYGDMQSVNNITNLQGLRWREETNSVQWRDLIISAITDPCDPVQSHGLSHEVKYIRIMKRTLKGRLRFYVQLTLGGLPLQRTPVAKGCLVGIDIGPSSIAAYDGSRAFLQEFCAGVEDKSREIRRLQRKLDRQRRANNPDCYDEKGRAIKGKHPTNKSNHMAQTEAKIAEIERQLAAHRKSLQGQMVNTLLAMGNVVQTEKLSIKAWQKIWGKSVKKHAPGTFMQLLRTKTAASGGEVREFSTYTTALSQTDHMTGKREKKSIGQRWHYFEDGTKVQRDLYTAFLAFCVDTETDTLNEDLANRLWACGAGSLLAAAFEEVRQLASSGATVPACFGLGQRQSESAASQNEHD